MPDRDTRDALVESACDAQRAQGKIPTVVNNERFIVDTLHGMDAKKREPKKPKPKKEARTRRPGAVQREVERYAKRNGIELAKGNWQIDKTHRPLVAGGDIFTEKKLSLVHKRLRDRVRLLRGYPEWADRIASVNPIATSGQLGPAKQKEAQAALWKVIEMSNEKFGHWMKPPAERPLYFHD